MTHKSFFHSIYTQFLLQFSLLALILVTFALIIAIDYSNRYNKEMYAANTNVTESICISIGKHRQVVSQMTQSLLSSDELTSFLNNDFSMAADYDTYLSSIQNYVQATINANPHSTIHIYMENPTIPMSMDVFYHLSDVAEVTPISEFLGTDEIDCWLCAADFEESGNVYLLPTEDCFIYLRKIYDYKKHFLGLLAFSIPEEYMLSFESETTGTILADGHSRIFNLTGDTLPETLSFQSDSAESKKARRQSYLMTWEYPQDFPFTIIVVTKASDYEAILWGVLLLLGLLVAGATLLCLRSLHSMVRQMHQCLTAMDASISNNYQTRVPVTGNNEISDICSRINLLLKQASELSRQNIQKETSNKESQLIALQHQINPHFIYNTMEVFSSKMKLYQHYEESDAMVAFANIFRYNIATSDSLVPVARELKQIEDYLHIQRLRYPSLQLCIRIPEEHMQILLPKFTLQPIIENAILHGIEDSSQPLCLEISSFQEGSLLHILITDNGIGMSPDDLAAQNQLLITSAPIPSDGHSVGLRNVNLRLQLFFGAAHHLTLTNQVPHGLGITFTVPYDMAPN